MCLLDWMLLVTGSAYQNERMDGIEHGAGQGQPPLHARIQAYLGGAIQAVYDAGIILRVVVVVLTAMGIVGMVLMWQMGPEEPAVALWCKPNVTVSARGAHHRTISDALRSAPRFSSTIYCIHITAGRYVENLVVDHDQTNIAFVGDGVDNTVIAAKPTCGNRHCNLQFATLLLKGNRFTAVNLTVENNDELATAAVDNRSDRSIFYRCRLIGRHGVVRAAENRQFYRDSIIQGAGSLMYGRAKAYLQKCVIAIDGSVRNVIYAVAESSTDLPTFGGGFTLHLCEISAVGGVPTSTPVLGSALNANGRVAFLECAIDIQGTWSTKGFGPVRSFFAVYDNRGVGFASSDDLQILDFSGASQLSLRNYFQDAWIPSNVPHNLDLGR